MRLKCVLNYQFGSSPLETDENHDAKCTQIWETQRQIGANNFHEINIPKGPRPG